MNSEARVSRKISKLRSENVPERQAVAMSLSMARKNRITKSGGYKRVAKKSRGKRGRRRYTRARKGR